MTLQSRETFYYKGEDLGSYNQPLDQHPNLPEFLSLGSFCRRGYNGTWSIRNEKLYLVDLYAHIPHIKETYETQFLKYDFARRDFYYEIKREPLAVIAHLEDVFPEVEDGKLFAYWFTGYVNFGQGEITDHGMTNSYKKYLSLWFENGVLIREQVRGHDEVYPPRTVEQMISDFKKKSP